MKAKVYLEPEYLRAYEGRCYGRTIRLAPAFNHDYWYAQFEDEAGEIRTFLRLETIVRICDVLREKGYDLRNVDWVETESKRHGYNPFIQTLEMWDSITPNVYFVKNPISGLIKIGHSDCYQSRIQQLQREFKTTLELLGLLNGGLGEEREIHGMLTGERSHKEWFHDTAAVREFIREFCYLPPPK